jgi:tRNA threonylcarbamoyladenosine biosynthesis protein TsaE
MHAPLQIDVRDAAGTEALGRALAAALADGSVVALIGTLGAGKTRLVQAVAEACGLPPGGATSPTFVLINEYPGRRAVFHFDAYRVKDEDEFRDLGPEEYFAGEGLTFVEWADRVASCLPDERLEIAIEVLGETARRFTLLARGARYRPVIDSLRAAMGAFLSQGEPSGGEASARVPSCGEAAAARS